MEQLYAFANQDLWLEFQEIELGNWAKKTLRDIAIEAKLKDVYDQHYQILSITAHAHWTEYAKQTLQCVLTRFIDFI